MGKEQSWRRQRMGQHCLTMNERLMMKIARLKSMFGRFFLLFILGALAPPVSAQSFLHPGSLHTLADLNRMKTNVLAGNHPWIDDWNLLIADSQASSNYSDHAAANMGSSRQNADLDAHAAYLDFMEWYISGNTNYANRAVKICNDWSAKVSVVPTGTDIPGLIGIPVAHFAEVGELLRIYPGWSAANFQVYTNMMVQFLYPVCNSFITTHNGACISDYWANWDACNIEALVAMGVLCDNTNIFNQGVNYFKIGTGMGSISNAVPYLYNGGTIGQWQESGRDQEHAQLGIGELGAACQTAWNQGVDLFGFANNRLLAGAEYVAQYNLGHTVPYAFYNNCQGANEYWISINGYGNLGDRPVWELIYNHYSVLQGLNAPNSRAMAQVMRPEHGSIDHFGYGTLTYSLNSTNSPYPPAPLAPAPMGLVAIPGASQVALHWAAPDDSAQGYSVLRSTTSGGPYTLISSGNASTLAQYTDTSVVNSTTYYYLIAANNQAGTGAFSAEANAMPVASGGLPAGWTNVDIGTVSASGTARFTSLGNNSFIITGNGTGIGGDSDSFQYACKSVTGNFTIVARLAALATGFGLMMRETLDTNAVALTLTLGGTGDRESKFGTRSSTGGNTTWVTGDDYTWTPVWYRLQRNGNLFTASHSGDGVTWHTVGSSAVTMANTYYVGMPVTTGTATFDNVTDSETSGPPSTPSGLVATAVSSGQVNLSWASVSSAASYNLARSLTSGGPYTNIASVLASTAYLDTSASSGVTYYYVVTANGYSTSPSSTEASATTPAPAPPLVPGGVTAAAGTRQILLNWTASAAATSYNVKRAGNSDGPFTNIAMAVLGNFVDSNVVSGAVYYYVVTAVNTNGESGYSLPAIAGLAGKLTGSIIGTAGSWNNQGNTIANVFDSNLNTFFDGPDASGDWVGLDFGAGVSNVITQIQYCPRATFASRMLNGTFQGANNPGFSSPVTLFTVGNSPATGMMTAQPISRTNAFRYVRYLGPPGDNCNVAEIEFDGAAALALPPAAPTSLAAAAGDGQVILNWAISPGTTGYNVKRSTISNGPYVAIAPGTATTTFTNTSLTNGTIYYFVVTAFDSGGESLNSLPASAQPVAAASPQLAFTVGSNQVQLNWPDGHTGWLLQVQTNSLVDGLGNGWVTVPASSTVNQISYSLGLGNGSVFFRLIHP